ncbi:MAG: serine hydrolase [Cyclonatronaceae bacterium]
MKAIFLFFSLIHLTAVLPLQDTFEEKIMAIDDEFSGNIGIYIKDLGNGDVFNHHADRSWYLASTIKIPVAIAILRMVEKGELSLDDTLVLRESDFVDGSGDLMYQQPGTEYTVLELLRRSIRESDSTATDMLIRLLGEDVFNDMLAGEIAGQDMGYITTIMQVRYDMYSEIHPDAENLSNLDIVGLRAHTPLRTRYNEFLKLLSVDTSEARVQSIPAAFERYYERGLNSGSLQTMGSILERLHQGDYLNSEHTELLIDILKRVSTGDRRIKAGLPDQAEWAHKTGTQISRSCNVGIVYPQSHDPVVIAACAEKYDELREAEEAFQKIGRLVTEKWFSSDV